MALSPEEMALQEEEQRRQKLEEEERKKREEEERKKKMLEGAGSGASDNMLEAKAIISMGAMTYSELANATPGQLLQINQNNLTEALQSTPALGMLKTLDPNFKLDGPAMQKDLAAWDAQFGNTSISQLDPAAINAHPLMQIPGVKNFVSAFAKQVNALAHNVNLSPEMSNALDQLNQVSEQIGDTTPVSGIKGKMAQGMINRVAKLAANQAVSGIKMAQQMQGMQKAFETTGALPTNIPGASGLVNVGLKFANKLMNTINPAAASALTPEAANAPDQKRSLASRMLKKMMQPTPPGGGGASTK